MIGGEKELQYLVSFPYLIPGKSPAPSQEFEMGGVSQRPSKSPFLSFCLVLIHGKRLQLEDCHHKGKEACV